MDHKEFKAEISRYLSGDLSGEQLEEFEVHYINCLGCRDALLLQKTVDSCIKEYIKTSEIPALERVLDIEGFLKEIQKEKAKIPLSDLIKNKILSITKRLNLIEQITSLKSILTFPLEIVPLGATRGPEEQKNLYSVGQTVVLSIEAPRDGHIAVFHYDSEGNLRLVFPRKKDDVTFAKSKEEKRIGMKVTEPAGKQWLKAVFFGREVIKPPKIGLEEDTSGLTTIEAFLDAIPNLKKDEWMESEYEFNVTEE